MCGILYIKVKNTSIRQDKDFEKIFMSSLTTMKYRGPDNQGVKVFENDYLGHVRLSIVGLGSSFNQPFQESGSYYALLFNGELYNYKSIDPSILSDTELLYKLMLSQENVTTIIRGMFSFCWYNALTKKASFYRDFFGEKPLYYYSDDDVFIASSTLLTIKTILVGIGKSVDLNTSAIITDYLFFGYIREPKTIYNNIHILPAGHSLLLDSNGDYLVERIDFGLFQKTDLPSLSYGKYALSATDVKKTLLVSSGLDSAMLLHLAKLDGDNHTDAIIYKSPNKEVDESDDATNNVKKILGKIPIIVSDEIEQNNIVKSFSEILEQPSSDGLNLFNLLTAIKNRDKSVRLIYTGLGGDELYGGYNSFKYWSVINILIRIPFISVFIPSLKRFSEGKKILNKWDPFVYYFLYRLDYGLYKDSFDEPSLIIDSYNSFWNTISPYLDYIEPEKHNAFMKIKLCEVFDYMKNQLLRDNDNISMHFSIESRSPLLDPDGFLTKPDGRKWMREIISSSYGIQFPKKRGFTYSYTIKKKGDKLEAVSNIVKKKFTYQSKKTHILNEWLKALND